MRYFYKKSNMESIHVRKKYLYDIFHLWFIAYDHGDYIELVSIPNDSVDICIIIGHNFEVNYILESNIIKENNIAIVTCNFGLSLNSLKGKNIFLSFTDNDTNYCYYVNGQDYGFDFNITQSEIVLYNYSKYGLSPLEMIEKSFNKLRESGENI